MLHLAITHLASLIAAAQAHHLSRLRLMAFVLRRSAARVICTDPDGRVLLIRATDPADSSKPAWWEIPGGGIDPGEQPEATCRRELHEEVGITDAVIGECVWIQHAQFSFAGWDFDQHEQIFVATASGEATDAPRLEAFEAMAFGGIRWFTLDELLADPSPTVPPRLREFLPDVLAGIRPDPPIDISPI